MLLVYYHMSMVLGAAHSTFSMYLLAYGATSGRACPPLLEEHHEESSRSRVVHTPRLRVDRTDVVGPIAPGSTVLQPCKGMFDMANVGHVP